VAHLSVANREMSDQIIGILHGFDNPKVSDAEWEKLVYYPWRKAEDPVGYVIDDGGKVCGFISTIFSRMVINGREELLCNLSSSIVLPDYRSRGGLLFRKALERDDYTITSLSCSPPTYDFYKRSGFKELDTHTNLISPLSVLPKAHRLLGFRATEDPTKVRALLNTVETKIYEDHLPYRCRHVVFETDKGHCYVIYQEKQSWYPYAVIYYVSAPELFPDWAGHLAVWLMKKHHIMKVGWDERLLRGRTVPFTKRLEIGIPRLFRSKTLDRYDIPNIYSELVMIDI
jgi:hypothetical protein